MTWAGTLPFSFSYFQPHASAMLLKAMEQNILQASY
jgi:hypothetical protein